MRRMMPPVLGWVGLAIAGVIAGVGAILGFWQRQPAQLVIVYTAATFALVLWAWNHIGLLQSQPGDGQDGAGRLGRVAFRAFLLRNAGLLAGLAVLLLAFLIASLSIAGFFTVWNSTFSPEPAMPAGNP